MKHTKVVVIMGVAILVAGSRPACSAGAPTIVEAADLWLELQSAGDGIQLWLTQKDIASFVGCSQSLISLRFSSFYDFRRHAIKNGD